MSAGFAGFKRFPSSKARGVKVIILDVDGVMTDGKIILDDSGREQKNFSVHDGVGISLGRRQGLKFAVITARKSEVTALRMRELGIDDVFQVEGEKLEAYKAVLKKHGIADGEAAYMGDDIHDEEPMRLAGLSAAPRGAEEPAVRAADYVTRRRGGSGAVREFIELVLKAKGQKLSLKAAAGILLFASALTGCRGPAEEPLPREPAVRDVSEKVEGGFRYTATERGRILFEIEGASASGLGEADERVTIEKPEAVWLREGATVRASGARGFFEKKSLDVVFEENARLEFEGRGEVDSDRLTWKRGDALFRAEGSVRGMFSIIGGERPENED